MVPGVKGFKVELSTNKISGKAVKVVNKIKSI